MPTRSTRFKIKQWVRSSTYLIPVVIVAASIGLAFGLVAIDDASERSLVYDFGSTTAVAALSAIAAGMITFTGFVVSVALAVVQFASGQYSPRTIRPYMRHSTQTKVALGVFVATFTYALIVLVLASPQGDPEFVPTLAVTVSIALVLLSSFLFVRMLHASLNRLRPADVAEAIAARTRRQIDRLYPHPASVEADTHDRSALLARSTAVIRHSGRPAVVVEFDGKQLVDAATEADVVIELAPAVGDFVPSGAPLFYIYGDQAPDAATLRSSVSFEIQRTFEGDAAWGFRLLVDIAVRALSPAVNDPTTATQVLDQIEDLLGRLGTRQLDTDTLLDDQSQARLIVKAPTWEDYVDLALTEIRQFGQTSVQITRRLRALIDDITSIVPAERTPALTAQLAQLDDSIKAAFPPVDRKLASARDYQGLGSGRDPVSQHDRRSIATTPPAES